MIKDLREMAKIAQETYETGVKIAVKKTVEKVLGSINIDIENDTYYVEMMTEKEAEIATDEQFDKYEEISDKVYEKLVYLKDQLYTMLLDELDEYATVYTTLYNDNTICVEVEVDEIEIELNFENSYNK